MKLDPKDPIIIVEVELFGKEKSRIIEMALDTGATYTMVPWKVVESLGYDPAVSKKRIPLVTVSSTEVVPLVTIKSIKVLGFKLDNIEIACHDLPSKSRVDGLLGLNFLSKFNVNLYFKDRSLEIKDP